VVRQTEWRPVVYLPGSGLGAVSNYLGILFGMVQSIKGALHPTQACGPSLVSLLDNSSGSLFESKSRLSHSGGEK
jgi:hypothetical protein